MAAFPHPQEAPLVPGSPPLPWPPKIPSLLFCLWLQWLLLMLPLASPWTDTPVGCLGFNHPTLLKYPSAFPASAPPQYHLFSPLGQNLLSPPLSSLPLGKNNNKKESTNSDREKKGAGETLLKPSEFLLPPLCLEAPWLMKSREELVGRGDCTKKSFPPLSPLPHQLGAHQGWEGSG